jgi:DNA-directed RNA polymerase specialized sigma subunit
MKEKNYANAKDVLPKELYEEVKKHFTGMMYVSERIRPEERKKLVLALCRQDMDAKEIAPIVGISARRVHQILAGEREKRLADAQKPQLPILDGTSR